MKLERLKLDALATLKRGQTSLENNTARMEDWRRDVASVFSNKSMPLELLKLTYLCSSHEAEVRTELTRGLHSAPIPHHPAGGRL